MWARVQYSHSWRTHGETYRWGEGIREGGGRGIEQVVLVLLMWVPSYSMGAPFLHIWILICFTVGECKTMGCDKHHRDEIAPSERERGRSYDHRVGFDYFVLCSFPDITCFTAKPHQLILHILRMQRIHRYCAKPYLIFSLFRFRVNRFLIWCIASLTVHVHVLHELPHCRERNMSLVRSNL